MSSPLAIAAVTQVMKGLLNERLSAADSEVATVFENVIAMPPDLAEAEDMNRLNVYMYMTKPNQGWRNHNYPSHNKDGNRTTNPYLALDLHYVISAYSDEDTVPEQLLGYAMMTFHEFPVIARQFIRDELTDPPLSTAGLAEQIEQIKITPDILSTEEVSRLWTSFGAKHRPSAYYKATVVLMESRRPVRAALPVKKPLIYVRPFKQPLITKVSSMSGSPPEIFDNQKIHYHHQLVIKGMQLKGEINSVLVSGKEQNSFIKENNDQMIISLPADLKSGLQSVQVIHKVDMGEPPTPRKGFSSNAEAFILSPFISDITEEENVLVNGIAQSAVQMRVVPVPEDTQQVTMFLNELTATNPKEYTFEKDFGDTISPSPPAGFIAIPIQNVANGAYLIRLRVDNAESQIADDYQTPAITIS